MIWIPESSGGGRVGDKRVQDHISGQHWSGTGAHRQRFNRDLARAREPGSRGSFVLIEHRLRQRVPINPTGDGDVDQGELSGIILPKRQGAPLFKPLKPEGDELS